MATYLFHGHELSPDEYEEAIAEGLEDEVEVIEDCEMCGGDGYYEKIGGVDGAFEADVVGIEKCQSCNY